MSPPAPAGDLYDVDILEWSEHQAALLRRIAAGEPVNEAPDWSNIIEEVESVGRSEWHAVEADLVQALLHDLKCRAWPHAPSVSHWRMEARTQRRDARRRYAPSMRQKIDLAELYRDALGRLRDIIDSEPSFGATLPVPAECPVSLDELLAEPS